MNQAIDILRSFHQRSIPYTVQGSTIVVGAKIDVLLEQNKKLSDEEKDRIKELNDRLDNPAKYAQYLIRYFEEKDIVELLNEFEKKFKRFDQKDVNKYDIKDLRDILRLAPKTKTEVKREGAEKVFENDEAVVLKVTTKEASCYYGKDTTWCISALKGNMFDQYYDENNIYFILSKHFPNRHPLNKVAVLVDGDNRKEYRNTLNKEISFSDIKEFNLQDSIFKPLTEQGIIERVDADFKTKLDGNVYKDNFYLPDFLVKNGEVTYDFSDITFDGLFYAEGKNLHSLKNLPNNVEVLDLRYNSIESFKDSPTNVEEIIIHYNELKSLEGMSNTIKKLYIRNNELKSLEGISNTIELLIADFNEITSLKGLPEKMKYLSIENNKITSLEGLPKKLDYLNISNNPGKFTEEEVIAVCDVGNLHV